MDMRHHVDLGSNETPGCLSHFTPISCVSVHMRHQLTLRSARLEHGRARVKGAGDIAGSTGQDQRVERRSTGTEMRENRGGLPSMRGPTIAVMENRRKFIRRKQLVRIRCAPLLSRGPTSRRARLSLWGQSVASLEASRRH
jgi:hypothetical protein